MTLLLTNVSLVEESVCVEGREVAINGPSIEYVGAAGSFTAATESVDLEGLLLLPGFIDLQVNGAGGVLFQTKQNEGAIADMARSLQSFGVTSFMPTLTPSSVEARHQAMGAVANYHEKHPWVLPGLNLEGPFINPAKVGMGEERHVCNYFEQFLEDLRLLGDATLFMTVAPEAISPSQTMALKEAGVVLSLGHTSASFSDSADLLQNGAVCGTHIFNAMSGISGREPGLVGAILDSTTVFSSLIADGYHVHAANVRSLFRNLSANRIFLISDAMPTLGAEITEFDYLGHQVTDRNGQCTTQSGMLAGTGVSIFDSCKNVANWLGVDFIEVLPLITSTPAQLLGLSDQFGSIKAGAWANIVAVTAELDISRVFVGGQEVHISNSNS